MGWGALMGLGEGLQKAGGIITENAKTKLLDKLEKEKEARADQRDIAREQRAEIRDNNKPVGTTIEPGPDGVLMAVTRNATGHTLDSRLASQEEIRQHNFEVQKDNASLEALTLGLDVKRKEAANWDNDHSLDTRYKESQIHENEAQGLSSIITANSRADKAAGNTGSFEDAVSDLVKDTSDIQREFTSSQGKDEDGNPLPALMTPSEYRRAARDAVKAAAQRGMDPRSFFEDQLRLYIKKTRK